MKKLVRIDFDNIGDKIDYHLINQEFEEAQHISDVIKLTISASLNFIKENFPDVKILLIGADDILFSTSEATYKNLDSLKEFYSNKTNLTVSIGVGNNIKETLINLKEAKVSGKNIIIGIYE